MLNEKPSFMLYPRGFVGPVVSEDPRNRSRFEINLTNIHTVSQRLGKNKPDLPFNEEIEALYRAYASTSYICNTMEYRERVIKAALTCFGTGYFQMWYEMQFHATTFGDTHSRFIDDCMQFILRGRRDLDPVIWMRTIEFTMQPKPPMVVSEKPLRTKMAQDFFSDETNASTINVVHRWLMQEGGLEDLVISMRVLFGQ